MHIRDCCIHCLSISEKCKTSEESEKVIHLVQEKIDPSAFFCSGYEVLGFRSVEPSSRPPIIERTETESDSSRIDNGRNGEKKGAHVFLFNDSGKKIQDIIKGEK